MKTLVFSFGRMNPITNGHEKLVKKVQEVARKERADSKIFLSHSQDAKKNPLSYDDKIKYAQKAFGKVIQKSNSKQIFQILKEIDAGYDNIIMVVGADRISEFETIIKKYNGKGDYEFKSIKVVSSGDRVDPDSDEAKKLTADAMSASVMRKLAAENDFESFKKGAPSKLSEKDVRGLFDAVRKGMNLKEDYQLDEVLDRQQRLAKSRTMKRLASRIAVARKRSMKRKATFDKIKTRAEKQARNMVRAKVAGKIGANYQDLSISSKEQVDKKVEKKKAFIKKLTQRLIPKVKQKEAERFKKMHESLDEDFELQFINEEFETLFEEKIASVKNKAEESGISYDILKQVYDRGMGAWETSHRPGTTPQQWAMARVNSFISGGKTRTTADADLWKQHKGGE